MRRGRSLGIALMKEFTIMSNWRKEADPSVLADRTTSAPALQFRRLSLHKLTDPRCKATDWGMNGDVANRNLEDTNGQVGIRRCGRWPRSSTLSRHEQGQLSLEGWAVRWLTGGLYTHELG
jgi:hypothetical protein